MSDQSEDLRYGYLCGLHGRVPVVMNLPPKARDEVRAGYDLGVAAAKAKKLKS